MLPTHKCKNITTSNNYPV